MRLIFKLQVPLKPFMNQSSTAKALKNNITGVCFRDGIHLIYIHDLNTILLSILFRIILFKCFLVLFLKHFWVTRTFFSFSCFGFLLVVRVEYSNRSSFLLSLSLHFFNGYQEANRLEALYVKIFQWKYEGTCPEYQQFQKSNLSLNRRHPTMCVCSV